MLSGLRWEGRAIRLGERAGASRRGGFYSFFFRERETFLEGMGLHTQANTRPAARPPSGQSDIPRKGNLGGGTTWPASPFYSTYLCNNRSGHSRATVAQLRRVRLLSAMQFDLILQCGQTPSMDHQPPNTPPTQWKTMVFAE